MTKEDVIREVIEEAYMELFREIQLKEVTISGLMNKSKIQLGNQKESNKLIDKLERELVKKDKKIAELKKTLQTERANK